MCFIDLKFLRCLEAVMISCVYFVKSMVSVMAKEDKRMFYNNAAFKAAKCAERGDFAGTFKVVRSLGKYSPTPIKAVRLSDGTITKTAAERELRWQEYFADLYRGTVCNSTLDTVSVSPTPINTQLRISVQQTFDYLQRLGVDKACGPDELPAKLLKAGGVALAVVVNKLETRSVETESMPVRWKGGRLVDLYKKKGDAPVCSNSRGLLISDHLSTAFVGDLLSSSKE